MAWRRTIQILGGVCIGIGVLSLCSNLQESIGAMFGPVMQSGAQTDGSQFWQDQVKLNEKVLSNRVYRGYLVIQGVLDALAALLLIVGGIGLLRVENWGRRLALVWGSYSLLSSGAYVVMLNRYLLPEAMAVSRQPLPDWFGVFFSLVILMLLWAFPSALLTLLTMRRGRRVFDEPPPVQKPQFVASPLSDSPGSQVHPVDDPLASNAAKTFSSIPAGKASAPPAPAPAQQTWRDDPWNDPDAT